MRPWRLTTLGCALVVLAGLASARQAAAQQYPTRPVELVVPFVPGGGTDLIARAMSDYLGKKWGQPLLVVNKPGGGGVIGARYALKEAKPDGYTVLVDIHTTAPMLIGAWKTPPLALADRKWAGRIVLDPMVFAVKADAPWKDFKEFSAWVKENPDKLVWSSAGPSGPSRYTAFDWFSQIGVDPVKAKMVITEGAADSFAKLAGGHVVLSIHSVAEAKALTEAGKIRLLAVLAPQRVRFLPNVPTAEEQGVMKGVSVSWWAGVSVPAGAPDFVVKRWESAIAEMVKDPAFVASTDRLSMNLDHLNADEMTAFVEKQAAYYTDMASKIGIRK
jgi:tripartite-type tricarboxylate transporter receptor subunit TctC